MDSKITNKINISFGVMDEDWSSHRLSDDKIKIKPKLKKELEEIIDLDMRGEVEEEESQKVRGELSKSFLSLGNTIAKRKKKKEKITPLQIPDFVAMEAEIPQHQLQYHQPFAQRNGN